MFSFSLEMKARLFSFLFFCAFTMASCERGSKLKHQGPFEDAKPATFVDALADDFLWELARNGDEEAIVRLGRREGYWSIHEAMATKKRRNAAIRAYVYLLPPVLKTDLVQVIFGDETESRLAIASIEAIVDVLVATPEYSSGFDEKVCSELWRFVSDVTKPETSRKKLARSLSRLLGPYCQRARTLPKNLLAE